MLLASATLGGPEAPGTVSIHRYSVAPGGDGSIAGGLTLVHGFEAAPKATVRAFEWADDESIAGTASSASCTRFSVAYDGACGDRNRAVVMRLLPFGGATHDTTGAAYGSEVMAQAWMGRNVLLNGLRNGTVKTWDTRQPP